MIVYTEGPNLKIIWINERIQQFILGPIYDIISGDSTSSFG